MSSFLPPRKIPGETPSSVLTFKCTLVSTVAPSGKKILAPVPSSFILAGAVPNVNVPNEGVPVPVKLTMFTVSVPLSSSVNNNCP